MAPAFPLVDEFKDIIKIVTLAPEGEGGTEFIKACKKLGIVVSIGHSNAHMGSIGSRQSWSKQHTHTFNGMQPCIIGSPSAWRGDAV
jgi:N-acetylglucosamine-6-phosphate deacetylase